MQTENTKHHVFCTVAQCIKPTRLDKYIASLSCTNDTLPTRSSLKAKGAVAKINGKKAKYSQPVKKDDAIEVEWDEEDVKNIVPEDIKLNIIYEDENVIAVNKAQGMVTHPAAGHWSGTLVNAVLFHLRSLTPEKPIEEADKKTFLGDRPCVVHRLDKDTSGAIIMAKNEKTLVYLQHQFKARSVRKEYIAIVKGRPPHNAGVIDLRIARDKHNRKRFTVTSDIRRGRSAKTIYHCISCYGQYSVMRLRLKTGRTHQIRVHLKHIGCPILGDAIYSKRDNLFNNATLMLHSRLIEIKLPDKKQKSLFIAPLPKRFIEVLIALKKAYRKETI